MTSVRGRVNKIMIDTLNLSIMTGRRCVSPLARAGRASERFGLPAAIAALWLASSAGAPAVADDSVGSPNGPTPRAVAPGAKPKPRMRSFSDVVTENFPRWDLNRDGRLESYEIDALMPRHEIQGEAAAALATIKSRERRVAALERPRFFMTYEQLSDPQYEVVTRSADVARDEHQPFRFEARFKQNLSTLEKAVRRLYADNGPNFSRMHQGGIGDCYFFSTTGSLAARHPQRIVHMIEPLPRGGYLVKFHGRVEVRVPEPTEAEILVNNSATSLEDGLWLPVLEIAFGELLRSHASAAKNTAEATDAMASGGSTAKAIQIYSGHDTEAIHLKNRPTKGDPNSTVRRLLTGAMSRGQLASVCMGSAPASGKKIPGLGYNHSYAILDFDPQNDVVTVWNPWGNTFNPKGTEGIEHGFKTEHGVFYVPLNALTHHFSTVIVERSHAIKAHR